MLESLLGSTTRERVLMFILARDSGYGTEIGRFFGLPLEVRHVTLVTGSLALSVAGLGLNAISRQDWLAMVAGVAVIGVCNLGVSFGLAFGMALRARRAGRCRSG